ncbi:MAG: glycosyltransferase family 2 protein [Desulfobacterales bacterium]
MKISIITICKNAEDTLEKTIQSVLAQQYRNIEYIIIDGASTDKTDALINKYRDQVATYISEKDHGIYNAMNKGIKIATGDIVFFLNAGDIFNDEFVVEKVVNAFSKADIEFLYGDVFINDGISERLVQFNHVDKAFFLDKNLCHQSIFYKPEVFRRCGYFDEQYSVLADYEWNVRGFLKYRLKPGHIRIPVTKFRLDGISTIDDRKLTEIRRQERRRLKKTYFNKLELMLFRRFLKKDIHTLNEKDLHKGKLIYVKLLKFIFRFNLYRKPIEL